MPLGSPAPSSLDHLRQGLAVDELHGVEVDAALAADGVDRHDVGVVQLAGGVGFVAEACQSARVEHRREGQHLQGDSPAERDLLGLVDDAHAAAADLADDAEVAEHAGVGCWMLDAGCWMCGVRRPAHNGVKRPGHNARAAVADLGAAERHQHLHRG